MENEAQHTPLSRFARGRRACQYCGEPESLVRVRVGAVVCFDCAEPGGRHDMAILGEQWDEVKDDHVEERTIPWADSTD